MKKTADELVAEGKRLSAAGTPVVFLYPSQEWMAVEVQTPFLRYIRPDIAPVATGQKSPHVS